MAESAFILLLIAAVFARYKKPALWWTGAYIASIISAYLTSIIDIPGVIFAVALISLSQYHSHIFDLHRHFSFNLWKTVVWATLLILSLLLATHVAPGFNNLLIHDELVLSQNSTSFSIYANYDKALVGMALLLLIANGSHQHKTSFSSGISILGITAIVVLGTATLLGYIEWNPKFEGVFFTWALTNLLITCLAEEAFFRLLVQEQILRWCSGFAYKEWLAIICSASLFGLAHLSGGADYAVLAAMAGICYAYIYNHYKSIEIAVISHFTVNALHFLLFTYPAKV